MTPVLSRRSVLAGTAAATCVAPLVPALAASGTSLAALDFDDPAHALRAYMKVISDLSGQRTYRYMTGRMLHVVPGRVGEPFMDFVSCKQDRVRQLTDGSYQHSYNGVILFCELDTMRVLDRFDNPVTGKTVDVRHFRTTQGSGVYHPTDGAYALRASQYGIMSAPAHDGEAFELQSDRVGDDLWLTYDERVEVAQPETGKIIYADSSFYRYHTQASAIADSSITSAPAIVSWSTETTFWSWMGMEGAQGHLLFGSIGRKFADVNQVPDWVIEASESRIPNHLARPIEWSDHTLPDPAIEP